MSPMFQQGITFLYTRDLVRTAEFYERVLGLPLARDQGDCRIYHVSEAAYVGFCCRAAPVSPEGVLITFVVEAVDAWAERLRAAGVSLEKEPAYNSKYGIYHLFFRDPNGYLIEVQRFDEPLTGEMKERSTGRVETGEAT
ncbi:MAG: VOC family protein [Chloroherpetonaceae bacterium]|nr:VOC family protein [Chthonomonadaceae bacterium]MDW8208214.1 VOC family protein [Chloroherpetonaceae bacterium]